MGEMGADVSLLSRNKAVDDFVIICVERPEEGAVVQPGATISGRGWVLANVDIEYIQIYLGSVFIGYAGYGEPRPDVAERFPSYAQADQSGFSFSIRMPPHGADQPEDLTVVVRTVRGRETRKVVSFGEPSAPSLGDFAALRGTRDNSSSLWPIRLFVEDARIDDAGLLRVRGWVLSLAPLLELRLFLGAEALGMPELGLSRPDVSLMHPDYPNATDCGFQLVQQVDGEEGQHPVVRIQAVCEGGVKRQIIAPVTKRSVTRKTSTLAGTQFCCDIASLDSRGRIMVSGWAVAESGVVGIGIELDGVPIGDAKAGLPRPDVGNRFPRIASARNAGFRFSHELGVEIEGEHSLTFRVRDGAGEEQTIPLPVYAKVIAEDTESVAEPVTTGIRFDLDQPLLAGDKARDPVRTTLTVAGWAVASGGIDYVDVTIDDRNFGHAYYGTRREDVAGAFPEIPEALLCGFAMHLRATDIGIGEHTVRVGIHTRSGDTAERSFSVVCEKSDQIPPSEMIRSKIGQVETDQGMAILDRLGHHFFDIHLSLEDVSAEGLAGARQTLASLNAQAYGNWRAVIHLPENADATLAIEGLADEMERPDARFPRDGDVTEAGQEEALPSLVCALRAGDRLGADALLEFAIHAALNPEDGFLYSDDRRRDPTTGAEEPFFKPDWSPDLLLSFNYIGRSWCARGAVLEAAGLGVDDLGAVADYEMALRLTECAGQVGHLPRLLMHEGKSEADPEVDMRALADAARRRGFAVTVGAGRATGGYRVAREVTAPGRVSIVIPTIAARGLIETTIRGLRENTAWPDIEIICLDNIPPGQNLYWKDWLQEHADKVIEITEPFNWSRFNNIGAAAATGDYLLFLNDDIEVIHPEWLEVLVSHAQRPEVGVVGAQLLYPDGKVQHAGMFLTAAGFRHAFRFAPRDEPGPFGLALSERNMITVTGACMLMRREAFERAGGFNETHSVVNNDVDYCLRAQRAGELVVFTPHATLCHHELASRAKMADTYDESAFHAEWGPRLLKGDPYYNRNLAQDTDMWMPEPEPVETIYAGHPVVDRRRIRRILALKLDHIGDFIISLPALRRIKQRFPEAELYVLCASASRSLAEGEPCVDGVLEFNFFHMRSGEGELGITEVDLSNLRERLQPYRFDLAIDLRLHPDTRRVLKYTGAPFLAGFENNELFPWLDVVLPWEGDIHLQAKRTHTGDRLTQLVEAVSVVCETDRSGLSPISVGEARGYVAGLPAFAEAPNDFFSGTVVCVHPGVGNDTRQWPVEHFAALIDLLVVELGAKVVIIGVGEEARIAELVLEKVTRPEGILSLAGKTSLEDLPYVLRACKLFVGNNSGPKHLAAALGVPTLGVHSAVVDAAEWGPLGPSAAAVRRKVYCGPCYLASASQCPRKLACLTGLRPIEAYHICTRLLSVA